MTLVLASAAALAGCGRAETDQPTSGKRYASQAECVADWGTPEDCKQPAGASHGGASWFFYGAAASRVMRGSGTAVSPGSQNRAVTRGGFGSTGRGGASS